MLKLQMKGKLLVQAQQLQSYLRNVEDAMTWISEHEGFVTSAESGVDLERVEVLQKKFDVFVKVRCTCYRLFPVVRVCLSVHAGVWDLYSAMFHGRT